MPYDEKPETEESNEIEDNSFVFNEPFDPIIAKDGWFSVDASTGRSTSYSRTCLVCRKPMKAGIAISINNGDRDKMEVGVCCIGHDSKSIAKKAIEKALELLKRRTEAISVLYSELLIVK